LNIRHDKWQGKKTVDMEAGTLMVPAGMVPAGEQFCGFIR